MDPKPKPRLVFMGTAALACNPLKALVESQEYDVCAVVTQPDKPKGRNLELAASAVKVTALELGLKVLQPLKARDPAFVSELADLRPELIIVVAYGQILPASILSIPARGCVNVHTSLLPKYRGAAPIQWALINGDAETGVTLMQMDPGLDTGPILASISTPIEESDNSAILHDRLSILGAELLLSALPAVLSGRIVPMPQNESRASYARKIGKEDGLVDWTMPAREIWNRSRGFNPWPGLFTVFTLGGRQAVLKLWECKPLDSETAENTLPGTVVSAGPEGMDVKCGEGVLRVLAVQKEGGRRLQIREFLAGNRIPAGLRFGETET